jgi:cation transport ATPase
VAAFLMTQVGFAPDQLIAHGELDASADETATFVQQITIFYELPPSKKPGLSKPCAIAGVTPAMVGDGMNDILR